MDNQFKNTEVEFTIPSCSSTPAIKLDLTKVKEGEHRLVEAKVVNGGTYSELEYTFNEGYRQAKQHLSTIMFQISMAKKDIRKLKGQYIIDEYVDFLKESKLKDNATVRDAFLETKEDYRDSCDRLAMLEAVECLFEGKIKVFENVCRYMRKEIDIQLRSGMIDSNKYSRL